MPPSPGTPRLEGNTAKTAKKTLFWELFAGYAGLTCQVAKRKPGSTLPPLDIYQDGDLLLDDVFTKVVNTCNRERVHWVHMAPPCRTFTKAHRSDQFGEVRTMRTKEAPEGKPGDQEAQEANLLANRCAALAIEQWKTTNTFLLKKTKNIRSFGNSSY